MTKIEYYNGSVWSDLGCRDNLDLCDNGGGAETESRQFTETAPSDMQRLRVTITNDGIGCYTGFGSTIDSYEIDVTVDDCVECDLETVTVGAVPNAVCPGEPVDLSASPDGTGSYTYLWTGPDALSSDTARDPQVSNAQNSGTYTVVVTDTEADSCTASGSVYVTVRTDCGACCFEDGTCADLTLSADCASQGGSFQGSGIDCATANCPDNRGACCFVDGPCQILLEGECASAGGSFQGIETGCEDCTEPACGLVMFEGKSTNTANGESLTLTVPSGVSVDDLLIAVVATDGSPAFDTPPAGWTEIDEGACANDACMLAVYYKVAAGGDTSTPSYTFGWDADEQAVGTILWYSGADPSNPVFIPASIAQTGTSINPNGPVITPTSDNARIVRAFAMDGGVLVHDPFALVKRFSLRSSSDIFGAVYAGAADDFNQTGASSSSTQWTMLIQDWRAITFAVNPETMTFPFLDDMEREAGDTIGNGWVQGGRSEIFHYKARLGAALFDFVLEDGWMYHAVDLTGCTDPAVTFEWRAYDVILGHLNAGEVFHVEWRPAGGGDTWTVVHTFDLNGENGDDHLATLKLPPEAETAGNIDLRFLLEADGFDEFLEIDSIIVCCGSYCGLTVDAGGNSPVCVGDPINLTSTVDGGGPFTYSWSRSTGAWSSTAANPTISSAGTDDAGTYSVVVTDQGADSCTGSAYTTVTVSDCSCTLTGADAGSNSPACKGGDINLTTNPTGGSGSFTYSWSGPDNFASSSSNPVISNAGTINAGDYTVVVTDTGANSCTVSEMVSVSVCAPSVTAGNDSPVCDGSAVNLSSTATGSGPFTFAWSHPGGWTSTDEDPTVSPAVAGTYTVVVTDQGCGSCTTTATTDVTVNDNPTVTLSGTLSFCQGGSTVITANVTGGTGTYTYDWSAGTAAGTGDTPAAGQFTATGAGTVQVTVTDSNGCTGTSTSVTIVVNPNPSVTLGGDTIFCDGTTTIITATASGGSTIGYKYNWTGSTAGGGSPSGNAYTATQTGGVQVAVTDSNNCVGTAGPLAVTECDPVPADAGEDQVVCAGESATLGADVVPIGNYRYSWTPEDDLDDPSLPNPTVTTSASDPSTTVTYTLVMTELDCNSCTLSDSMVLTNNANPECQIAVDDGASDGVVEPGSTHTSWIADPGPGATIAWAVEDDKGNNLIVGPDNDVTVTIKAPLEPATIKIAVSVADANGCTCTFDPPLIVPPDPDPEGGILRVFRYIPTLAGWGLMGLAALMAGAGAWAVRRRKRS